MIPERRTKLFFKYRNISLLLIISAYISMAFSMSVYAEEKDYIIGEGDVLSINVWKEPDLTIKTIRVRLDGKITFPLLDDVQAAGISTIELKNTIQKKLSEYVEAPTVTVSLLGAESKRFYILGEIKKTGEYKLIKNLTVMQAFALAGGFTEWASKKEILLFRYEKGEKKKIVINYKDILKGDFTKNIEVKTEDIIVIP